MTAMVRVLLVTFAVLALMACAGARWVAQDNGDLATACHTALADMTRLDNLAVKDSNNVQDSAAWFYNADTYQALLPTANQATKACNAARSGYQA